MITKLNLKNVELKLFGSLSFVIAASVSSSMPAQALQFKFSYAPDTPVEVISGFYTAGDRWGSQFTDDATINIHIDYGELASSVTGGTRSAMEKISYENFIDATFGDLTSASDLKALSKLNDNDNNKHIWLTRANAKALDLVDSNDDKLDASIRINNSIPWDFARDHTTSDEAFDFQTMAQHEIGHALGFVSGVDAFELLSMSAGKENLEDKDLQYVSPMDLYRYSEKSAAEGVDNKFFSLDGGLTQIANFSSGEGYQGSHWETLDTSPGIMSPTLAANGIGEISDLDRQLLDVIGWDLTSSFSEQIMSLGLDWKEIEQKLSQRIDTVLQQQQQERDAVAQDIDLTALDKEAQQQAQILKINIQEKLKELQKRYNDAQKNNNTEIENASRSC